MLAAYGHTVVREFPPERFFEEKLHRSLSASVLLNARIPAFTAELGTGHQPDPAIVEAACAGTRNVLRWAGMLTDGQEAVGNQAVARTDYPVRRRQAPRVDRACVVRHLLQAGDPVGVGDPVAEICDIWGRPLESSPVRSEDEGFVLGRCHGIFFYPGDALYTLAVRDDTPVVGPYPSTAAGMVAEP
jgi:predicted deacylase